MTLTNRDFTDSTPSRYQHRTVRGFLLGFSALENWKLVVTLVVVPVLVTVVVTYIFQWFFTIGPSDESDESHCRV